MAERSRYSLRIEESGVEGGVLKNKLHLDNQTELDDAETILLSDTYTHFFTLLFHGNITFDLALLVQIHKYFLATLYPWAGKIRTVDMSKDGTLFAPAEHIAASLDACAATWSMLLPKDGDSRRKVASNLAIVHCELNAVHPFREGNGRTIRLFLDLFAAHVGYNLIDWSKSTRDHYLRACIDGMSKEYSRMEKVIYLGLTKRG